MTMAAIKPRICESKAGFESMTWKVMRDELLVRVALLVAVTLTEKVSFL